MACGKGRLIHSDGDIYEGEWRNDKAHGYVIIFFIIFKGKICSYGWSLIYRIMGR